MPLAYSIILCFSCHWEVVSLTWLYLFANFIFPFSGTATLKTTLAHLYLHSWANIRVYFFAILNLLVCFSVNFELASVLITFPSYLCDIFFLAIILFSISFMPNGSLFCLLHYVVLSMEMFRVAGRENYLFRFFFFINHS